MNDYVTPQMFGAKGDGRTDDSDAFQKAVDSGYDVYVPTARRETYLITKTISVTNPNTKRIFSEPISRMGSTGMVVADLRTSETPKTTGLFDVHIQLMRICGLKFTSKAGDHRAGVFINAMDDICDYDIRIEHCGISNFYRVARFFGRGFELLNSQVGSCQNLADFYWDDGKDTNENHPAEYDQRAICVKNCRLHNIASAFIIVRSGHAYGLHFVGNTIDNGKGFLFRAYDQADGWNISGNVIQGIRTDYDAMEFRKGMLNCLITGNTFIADKGYWKDTIATVKSWLKCSGNTVASIISGNVFKNSDGGFMSFRNIEGSSIVGNTMHNVKSREEPAIDITGTCRKTCIVANSVLSASNSRLLSKTLSSDNAVVGNCPNT